MAMRRLAPSLAAILFVGPACGTKHEPRARVDGAAMQPAGSPSASFVPGRVYRYAFSWSNRSAGRGPAILPEDVPVTGGLELSGILAVRALPPDGENDMIAVSIEGLEQAELRVFDQNVLADPSVLLHATAYVELPAGGELRRVFVSPDMPPIARRMLTGLVGRIDLHTVSEGSVPATQGLARARYEREGSTIRREILESVRADANPGPEAGAPEVRGDGRLVLDPSGEVSRVENFDVLTIESDDERPLLRADTRFEAVRESVHDEPLLPRPDLQALDELDLWDPPDDAEARREMARRYADGLTSFDAAMTIRAAGNGLPPPRGFAVRAVGMLRGWPERAQDMLELYDASPDDRARLLVFDLLASAGTEEAQRAMLELAGRDAVRDDDLFPQLVQRFGFVPGPRPELGEHLLEAEALAQASGRAESRRALLYPMGAVARRLADADPVLAEALLVRVRHALRHSEGPDDAVAALAGLGNAGRAEDYERIVEHTQAEDPFVRGMAAVALRHHRTTSSVDRLFEMLADPDPYVARQAIEVLDEQRPPDHADRLAAVGLAGDYNASIAYALGDTMLSETGTPSSLESALVAMRNRTDDPRTAEHLGRWLNESR